MQVANICVGDVDFDPVKPADLVSSLLVDWPVPMPLSTAQRFRGLFGAEFVRLCGLLSLCAGLSVLTIREQHDTGASAGRSLGRQAIDLNPTQVMIVIPADAVVSSPGGAAEQAAPAAETGFEPFMTAAHAELKSKNILSHEVRGDAREVRKQLEALNAAYPCPTAEAA